jgi:UDP:flavonoid glycosyltransferase YjiC (YdhE family)
VLHGYSRAVLPQPPEWTEKNLHVTGYWHLDALEGWEPSRELLEFLEAGEPPVYVGFGSMDGGGEEGLTSLIVKALSVAGHRGILLSGWGGVGMDSRGQRSPGLPDNVLVVDEVPHSWLLPRVAAAVHHGGAGTTAASLRAGISTVIVPFFADQKFWGARIADLGVGPAPIPRGRLSVSNLAAAIGQATSDREMISRAQRLGRTLRSEDGVGAAVEYIERYAFVT